LALEALREIETIIGTRRADGIDTHPTVSDRIARFDTVALLKPREFEGLKNFRIVAERVMRAVHSVLLGALRGVPKTTLHGLSNVISARA
jgi:hypothetical protein